MKFTMLWAVVAASSAVACPALPDGQTWHVRSVRPRTAATQPLVGTVVRRQDIEVASRSFDATAGSRFSVTVTIAYLEHCEAGEADLVFRSFRLRIPRRLGLTPVLDLARGWTGAAVNGQHKWAGDRLSLAYAAGVGPRGLRHTGSLEILGDDLEARITAGNDILSARLLAAGPPMWILPLLPAALRQQPEFDGQIQAALSTAESMLRLEGYAQDPAFQLIVRRLGQFDPVACLPDTFRRRLAATRAATGGRQYGLVDALLAIDVPSACDSAGVLPELRSEFARINRQAAAQHAAEEIFRMRELADHLLYRMPLLAVRPVAVAEAIRSGARTALPAIGAGVRVSLFGWLDTTAGYAWKLRRPIGSPSGTPFIEMRFRDPFR